MFVINRIVFFAAFGIFFSVIFLQSCKKDDYKHGLSVDIQNIVPDTLFQKIIDLGMPINTGFAPPNIENIFQASPFVQDTSNIPNDPSGFLFTDFNVEFFNQDSSKLTIGVSFVNGPEVGKNLDGFISGDGTNFSVFLKQITSSGDKQAELVQIISGTRTNTGIKNFHYAVFMLNNFGNANKYWIENGQGRIIYDSDGDSPIIETLYSFTKNEEKICNPSTAN